MSRQRKCKGHIHGEKFCKHTTVTNSAQRVARFAETLSEVSKISLGIIKRSRSKEFGMKFSPMIGGIMVAVKGSQAVQRLHIYTTDPEQTRKHLEEKLVLTS